MINNKKVKKWFSTFNWGDDETGLWNKANENGATILLNCLIDDGMFITVDHDKKSGNFTIGGIIGPIHFEVKKDQLEEDKEWGANKTHHSGNIKISFDGRL